MVVCIIGTVVEVDNKALTIEDRLTKQHYKCESEGDDFLNLKINDQGVFIGQSYNNIVKVRKYEIRKFLDPLYEADLYDASGKFTLIPVIEDPFTEAYLKFLERQQEIDEAKEQELIIEETGMPQTPVA